MDFTDEAHSSFRFLALREVASPGTEQTRYWVSQADQARRGSSWTTWTSSGPRSRRGGEHETRLRGGNRPGRSARRRGRCGPAAAVRPRAGAGLRHARRALLAAAVAGDGSGGGALDRPPPAAGARRPEDPPALRGRAGRRPHVLGDAGEGPRGRAAPDDPGDGRHLRRGGFLDGRAGHVPGEGGALVGRAGRAAGAGGPSLRVHGGRGHAPVDGRRRPDAADRRGVGAPQGARSPGRAAADHDRRRAGVLHRLPARRGPAHDQPALREDPRGGRGPPRGLPLRHGELPAGGRARRDAPARERGPRLRAAAPVDAGRGDLRSAATSRRSRRRASPRSS